MRRVSLFSPPSWSTVEDFVRCEIDKQWHATDLDIPYTSFITRERLDAIWNSQLPHQRGAHTPFEIFCRYTSRDLTFPDFYNNLIRLCSALLYVGWERLTSNDDECKIRWSQSRQARLGLRNSRGRWVELSDANLPLAEEHIQMLFGTGHSKRVAFRDSQFPFSPIVIIAGTRRPREYGLGTRIPFESVKATTGRKGWYGNVDEVKIVEGYIEWERPEEHFGQGKLPTANKVFACKTFRVRENFFDEHDKLVTLGTNQMRDDHIMMHIAAFVVGHQFKILFPWAWADLNQFFGMDPGEYPPWLIHNAVSPYNMFREARSLGQALSFLHHNLTSWEYGPRSLFHMDLKSDNILVVSPHGSQLEDHPLGVWKITDFGLSDFGISHPGTEVQYTMIGDVVQSIQSSGSRPFRQVGPFQAPEAERQGPSLAIDQAKADVWSFGCVLTELLAFSALGPAGFRRLRRCLIRGGPDPDQKYRNGYFYTCSDTGVFELVPSLNELLGRPYGDEVDGNVWFSTIWQLISTKALSIDPKERPKVGKFCEELRKLVFSSSTPERCLFSHGQPIVTADAREAYIGEGSVRSEPTARMERSSIFGPSATRSSSGPPQLAPHTPSRASVRLPLRISTGEHARVTEQYVTSPSTFGGVSVGQQQSPSSPRVSGSLSNVASSPLQLSTSSPAHPDHSNSFLNLAGDLADQGLKPEFVTLSPDGTSIIFSDGSKLVWSQISSDFSVILRNCNLPKSSYVGLNSVQPTMLSILIKCDNKRIAMHSIGDDIVSNTPVLLNHITKQREVRATCISPAQCVAVEFVHTIEAFDFSGRRLLRHQKNQPDFILDLAFDQSGEYLFAVSQGEYWIWRREVSGPCNYVQIRRDTQSMRGCISGFQSPKILTIRGSSSFLVQEADLQDEGVRIAIIDEGGPRQGKITSAQGSIKSPLCITTDCQELFAGILPSTTKRTCTQSPCSLARWKVTSVPRIIIEPTSMLSPSPMLSLSKFSYSKPGRLCTASVRVGGQGYALVALSDGRIYRFFLASTPDSLRSVS